jgi:hypothetical protein
MRQQIPRERINELLKVVALPREIFAPCWMQRDWMNVISVDQKGDVPLCDWAATVVIGPDSGRIFAEFGGNVLGGDFLA